MNTADMKAKIKELLDGDDSGADIKLARKNVAMTAATLGRNSRGHAQALILLAGCLCESPTWPDVRKYAREAVRILEALGLKYAKERAAGLYYQGVACSRLRRFQEAEDCLKEACALWALVVHPNSKRLARAVIELSILGLNQSKPEDRNEVAKRAYTLAHELYGKGSSMLRLLDKVALFLEDYDDQSMALRLRVMLLYEWSQLRGYGHKQTRKEMESVLSLMICESEWRRAEILARLWKRKVALIEGKDHREYLKALEFLSEIYKEQGQAEKHIKMLKEMADCYDASTQCISSDHMQCLYQLGMTCYKAGNLDEAIQAFRRADHLHSINHTDEDLDPQWSLFRYYLARLYEQKGWGKRADAMYKSIEYCLICDEDGFVIACTYAKIASIYARSWRTYNKAVDYYYKTLNDLDGRGMKFEIVWVENALALLQLNRKPKEAKETTDKALKYIRGEESFDPETHAVVLNTAALVHAALKKYTAARTCLTKAIGLMKAVPNANPSHLASMMQNLSTICLITGQGRKALTLASEARQLTGATPDDPSSSSGRVQKVDVKKINVQKRIARDLIRIELPQIEYEMG